MRFIKLHLLGNGVPVAINVQAIGYVHDVTSGASAFAEVFVQGQPDGNLLRVQEDMTTVINRIAFVTGDFEIK